MSIVIDWVIKMNEKLIIENIVKLPYKLALKYFIQNMEKLSDEYYWQVIRALWIDEGVCNDLWELLFFYSGRKRQHKIMKSSDRQALKKLPKEVTIYRGCKEKTDENKFNWSLDKTFVERYIKTMQGYYIAEKKINKKEIFAYFNSRNEQEVILKRNKKPL